MAWHLIAKRDVTMYRSYLARRGDLARCDVYASLPDGRSTTVEVFSQRGVRREVPWAATWEGLCCRDRHTMIPLAQAPEAARMPRLVLRAGADERVRVGLHTQESDVHRHTRDRSVREICRQ